MKWIVVAVLILSATVANGQEGLNAVPTPSDAMGWAIAHQLSVPEEKRGGYRYLWIPPWMPYDDINGEKYDERHIAAIISYAVNEAASQTGIIIQPETIANGWMVAVYLPSYASSTKKSLANNAVTELQQLVNVWDGLAVDEPYFHVTDENSQQRVAILAPHLKAELAGLLSNLNSSPALVYRADHFLERLLGDKYYEFMQFGTVDGKSVVRLEGEKRLLVDQRNVYDTVGVSEALAEKVDGDQRIALFISNVTGKPRRVDRIQGAAGRNGTGAVWQTWDVADESVDTTKHPLYNLLNFKSDGGEAIYERPNGLHGYILYDGEARNLVTEGPPNIVTDHNIPPPPDGPGTKRLLPGISCIRCHGAAEGLQTAGNDVRKLLDSGTDILDDLSRTTNTPIDNINRLAGLYAGDFGRRIALGRDDYTAAVRRATIMPGVPAGMDVPTASKVVAETFRRYAYDRVTPKQACWELGYNPGENPSETLRKILPPVPSENGIAFENVIVASLRAGIPVRRKDWEQIYAAARLHVVQSQGVGND